ncbi:MAG: FAD-binding protein, partial [Gemmatimonadetes bacterium]|nr:FAD-binding protein [Gemmatimonadota bacterium]NIQ54185.1 FAD-binding protein [Gemmatimonadota bacterium]NIU74381.1 FAD-binding protein [Gammaproteobacteria bacterium]NIX44373.1 FAD-binding protein [Gemmatimonadota bacterium]
AADLTGREIERTLLDAAAGDPNIEIREDHLAVELAVVGEDAGGHRCTGAVVLDLDGDRLYTCRARFTLLATGGLGRVYRHT